MDLPRGGPVGAFRRHLGRALQGGGLPIPQALPPRFRMAGGIDLFSKYSDQTEYARYENRSTGGQLRLGFPVTDEFGFTLRYSLYQQEIKVPNTEKQPFNDCTVPLATTQLNGPNAIPG